MDALPHGVSNLLGHEWISKVVEHLLDGTGGCGQNDGMRHMLRTQCPEGTRHLDLVMSEVIAAKAGKIRLCRP